MRDTLSGNKLLKKRASPEMILAVRSGKIALTTALKAAADRSYAEQKDYLEGFKGRSFNRGKRDKGRLKSVSVDGPSRVQLRWVLASIEQLETALYRSGLLDFHADSLDKIRKEILNEKNK